VDIPTIKSFKLRGNRITAAQESARARLWEAHGIELSPRSLDFDALFPRADQIVLEIGFGMGEATVEIAKAFPETGFLAIDVHQPGIGKLLSAIEENAISNIYVMEEDAHLILQNMIPDSSLNGIHLFFPDPWPKSRHHKRRIVNEAFISLVASKLKSEGTIHMATDWAPYASWMQERFDRSPLFMGGKVARPNWRPLTRFEGQGLRKDHEVADLIYRRL
jgi:tRNA (guanine-N7-)-methyltransferase